MARHPTPPTHLPATAGLLVLDDATFPRAEPHRWVDDAACRGREELFYNEDAEPKGARRAKEQRAKGVCAACPVLVPCRAHAIEWPERYGVWGGLTEAERHRLAGRGRTG